MLNSIGLKEGHEFREEQPKCTCVWVCLLMIPPVSRLERKCNYCRSADGEPLLPEAEHSSERLPEWNAEQDAAPENVTSS